MRGKISITLSEETIQALDDLAVEGSNRSRVIEEAIVQYVANRRRAERERRDLEILNRAADALNREVEEVLAYQVEP
jgi:metal-responsive CopG/Arc/MetJ family transcriptional regulator